MAWKNVSKIVIRELRDACDRILSDESKCGDEEHFVMAMAVDSRCSQIALVECYSEFDGSGREYRVPLYEALQIVAKHIAYATWNPERTESIEQLLNEAVNAPLTWGPDGAQMLMRHEMTPESDEP